MVIFHSYVSLPEGMSEVGWKSGNKIRVSRPTNHPKCEQSGPGPFLVLVVLEVSRVSQTHLHSLDTEWSH